MMRRQDERPSHRGISFGTILMSAVTVVVLGLSAVILPRLLGTADFTMDAGSAFAALTLDGSMPALRMSDIPISDATQAPAATDTVDMTDPVQAEPVHTPVPTPTATPVPGGTVQLTLGGSVNIDDLVRKSAYYSDSEKYDFTEIMALLKTAMASDLTMVTLENITCDEDKVSSVNAPSVVMDMLADAGVQVVAVGFPKAFDKGMRGLSATMEAAASRGMHTVGGHLNERDAGAPLIVTVDGVRVAVLHYTASISSSGKKAMQNEGAAYAVPTTHLNGTPDAMLAEIRQAKADGADIVIVSLNWGTASASKPDEKQRELAQQIADAGADVIVGAGSRVVQPVTWLTSKAADGKVRHVLCAWSLGSLINESRKDGNVVGMLLQLQIAFDGEDVSFEKVCYTPTYIWRYKQDGQNQYRIAISNQPPPDGMSDDQIGYMEKAFRNIQKYLGDSPVTPLN